MAALTDDERLKVEQYKQKYADWSPSLGARAAWADLMGEITPQNFERMVKAYEAEMSGNVPSPSQGKWAAALLRLGRHFARKRHNPFEARHHTPQMKEL
ncbi:MAG: hypothetical protein RKP20_08965 [Candidatus Competibacter sp.]|nr:hypothetical protein [Candidatus Competibacter sp.]